MPGDCSPSRSVVSKISTRLGSCSAVMSCFFRSRPSESSHWVCGYRRPPRISPLAGEEQEKAKVEQARHALASVPELPVPLRERTVPVPLWDEDDLADVLALLDDPVGVGGAVEGH